MVLDSFGPVQSFDHVFGAFCEVQNGRSFDDAVMVSSRILGKDPGYYSQWYSNVLCKFIASSRSLVQSSPWTGEQKSGMEDIRRRFNRGMRTGDAKSELRGLGLSPGTAAQLVRQWEDRMPGFDGDGFDGLGEERIVLRPNQTEKRRASREARSAELEDMRRFDQLQRDLFAAVKRKRSKYNGSLVNTFPEGLQGVAPVGASVDHPSIRYQVLCHLVAPENRWLVESAFSGNLDSSLYGVYEEASGGEVDPNVADVGDNGRVVLKVDTGSGVSTEVDLGGSLDTGYVVESISDPLGIFPEGTEQGDFLEFGTVETILKALADRGEGYPGLYSSRRVSSSVSPGDHVELRFTSVDGSSDKFIDMDYSGGPTFTATWGRFGSAGRQTEYPVSEWDAYYRGKTRKGYTDVTGGGSVVPQVRSPSSRKDPVVRKFPESETPGKQLELDLFGSRRPSISRRFSGEAAVRGLRLLVSGSNSEAIQRAVMRIQAFLDSVGARYRFHDSSKSDSAYFHVREPAVVAEDPSDPDVVDTRVSDHSLPSVYDPPDLDVSVPKPRPRAVSPDFAVKLLKDFLKGKIDIAEGEVIPVDSSLGGVSMFGLRGSVFSYRKVLYPLSESALIQSKLLYHGTPNKVGEAGNFSTEFVGAGEGAQFYGWGLYFAENREVSENMYRKRLSSDDAQYFYKDRLIDSYSNLYLVYVLRYLSRLAADKRFDVIQDLRKRFSAWAETAIDQFRDSGTYIPFCVNPDNPHRRRNLIEVLFGPGRVTQDAKFKIFQSQIQFYREFFDSLDANAFRKEKGVKRGYTYTVDLKAPDDLFIDWDVSWAKQPSNVRERLRNAKTFVTRKAVRLWSLQDNVTGGDFLKLLYQEMGGEGSSFRDKGIAKAEAMDLRKTGIHGVRYLDGNSRRRGRRYHNYVIYDENDIETVLHPEEYGQGQMGLFTQEEMVIPSKRASASFRRILSAVQQGEAVALSHLADLINATQADVHYLHFYAGGGGNWDRIHDVCADYYLRLAEAYDDVVELCLQVNEDITHPNDSASAVGFENSVGSMGNAFEYESVMQILQDRLHNLVDVAAGVAGGYQGGGVNATAVRNYLEGFVGEWSKEADYRLKERLGGERDFGGAYRDRASGGQVFGKEPEGELITGDAEEVV